MENDLISRSAAIEAFRKRLYAPTWTGIQRELREMPGVDAVDVKDDDFGAILNCAVRYAIGRQTYMPSLVIGFITPLIPQLGDKTLACFDQDVTEARWSGGYGDPQIDEPVWMQFLESVRSERIKRGETPFRSWRASE